ncbi:CRISPR-associated helicase Cas3' [Tomitella fengzijianii]|uniref:CRISPR-associated helicase Cas3 n=1 Tax=Tomitella fengzijianii TaxID=2597660 RepID=A0A516X675_9ACTN|nr:CRISPR-associated helicase Cas3' [Tomitella fengzijianii]QDQ98564.1 CRISPR-associated helicase Cas3' [Tomitella fengzijianii]
MYQPGTTSSTLSAPASSAWAKSDRDGNWAPLARHMADSAAIAGLLWDEFLSPAVRRLVIDAIGDEDRARRVAVWMAGGHDLGKCTPAFAIQAPALCDRMIEMDLEVRIGIGDGGRKVVPHSLAGFTLWTAWLEERGVKATRAWTYAAASGGHHGVYPDGGDDTRAMPGTLFTGESQTWRDTQWELADFATTLAGITVDDIATFAKKPLPQQVQVLLTGFTIMADWLASNERWFPLTDGARTSEERADAAVRDLRFPAPWSPEPPHEADELLRSRFGLSAGRVRPVQAAAVDVARACAGAELMIIEAPTGEGKTFAALAAAEVLAARFGLGGLQFALPTCATSDGMFPTIARWLPTTMPSDTRASLALSHGRAQFNDQYQGLLGRRGFRSTGIGEGTDRCGGEVVAHWWLSGRKSAALADFVVCTIDQILFSALSSRHVMLRHLGMAGKVVVLDEIHAADAFMSQYLHRALEWLAAYGVPVIALSATLPPAQRTELLTAYNKGRGRKVPSGAYQASADAAGYPLITVTAPAGAASVAVEPSSRRVQYQVEWHEANDSDGADDAAALASDVAVAAADSGCIAVVCNTVRRAQAVFGALQTVLGDDVVLLHSRFVAQERARIENRLRTGLGPDAGDSRPKRLVVVATQVVEQSLDLDFDLMFTDIAPLDLVIQRAGRLHRHARESRPRGMERARLVITGTRRSVQGDPRFAPGLTSVYPTIALLRSVACLDAHGPLILSPADVPGLVRFAYDEGLEPPADWRAAWAKAEDRDRDRVADQVSRAKVFRIAAPKRGGNMRGWNSLRGAEGSDDALSQAQVRDAADALEVIVVQRISGAIVGPPWAGELAGMPLESATVVDDDLARTIARWTVRFPAYMGDGKLGDAVIDALEENKIDSWQNSRWLGGALALVLDEDLRAVVAGFDVAYDVRRGLIVKKCRRTSDV